MNGDLISRSALIEYLCSRCSAKCNLEEECCSHVDAIENAPAVDAVPVVHGKPEPHMVQCIGYGGKVVAEYQDGWQCPFCGEPGVENYCPNCGAKMDGERKGNGVV